VVAVRHAFVEGRRQRKLKRQRKVGAAMAARPRVAVFAGRACAVLVTAIVRGCLGVRCILFSHRTTANGHAHVRQRLHRKGKRDQQG
jgi:hypothetical protein